MKIVIKLLLILSVEIVIASCSCKHSNIQDVVDGYSSGYITEDSLLSYLKNPINFQQIKEWAFDDSYSEDSFRQFIRGYCLYYGKGVLEDKEKARIWLEKSADKGHEIAQALLAHDYYDEKKDYESAYFWYKKSADQGLIRSQICVAVCFEDSINALAYLQLAANQGDDRAQYYLGGWYYNGNKNVPKDYKEAAKWFEKSAEQGNPDAQWSLAYLYYTGYGVPQNFVKAKEWCEKAVKQDNLNAIGMLGVMYAYGEGVEKNDSIAFMYLKRAADLGDEISQRNIGSFYLDGRYVKRDETTGIRWTKLSAKNGDKAAQDYLKKRGINW